MILGSAGSGKSTLAKEIGKITGIEVLHMDTLFWAPGWVEVPKEKFQEAVQKYIQRDSWITDGNYRGTLDERLTYADTIIFIDIPRVVCLYRAIKRSIIYRHRSRPDITQGCNERFEWGFCKWIWNYPVKNKPAILKKIQMYGEGKEVYYIKNKKDMESLLRRVKEIKIY